MYLKCLELHGFKSFPNRTILTFERGSTVVVGPNGSGKSNISDAMRWVLGEISSRNIRGTKMEDVIFTGTDTRRPMGFAEVSVTFDNTDKKHRIDTPYEEITVTRRYYRGGDSEYMINRKPCRLRDIHELFMNTGIGREGYSIIGQGKVAEMISKKSDERRNIFEEAAGISKFRHRKQEAERKLEETKTNMDRLGDIVHMLYEQKVPLEKEAEKARKYMAVYEEKKAAEVALWLYDTEKVRVDLEKAEERYKLSCRELEIVTEALAGLERRADFLENQSLTNRLRSEELLNKINATTSQLHTMDNQLTVLRSDLEHLDEMTSACELRILTIGKSEEGLDAETEACREAVRRLGAQVEELTAKRLELLAAQQQVMQKVAEYDRRLNDTLAEQMDLENQAAAHRTRIEMLRTSAESESDRSDALRADIAAHEEKGKTLRAEAERCDRNASGFRTKIEENDRLNREMQALVEKGEERREQLKNTVGALEVSENTLRERAAALKRMEEHFEGYSNSVRFVMQKADRGEVDGTVYGPLSKLIHIEKPYAIAIETALGAAVQHIVVDTEETAKSAIELLKRSNAGRATFLPVSAIRSPQESDEIRLAARQPGYVGRADKLVTSDDRFRQIVEAQLLRTVVFDNLDHAIAASRAVRQRVRMVTLDGQQINAGGSMTGGSVRNDSGILSRSAEIAKLTAEAEQKHAERERAGAELSRLESDLASQKQKMRDYQQNIELLHTMSRSQFAALDKANADLDANENLLTRLRQDLTDFERNSSRSAEELEESSRLLEELSSKLEQMKKKRADLAVERNREDDRRAALAEEANNAFIAISETNKDIESTHHQEESIARRRTELAAERDEQNRLIAEYREKRNETESRLKEDGERYAQIEKELAGLRENRSDVESDNMEHDKLLAEVRGSIRVKTNDKETAYRLNVTNENRLNSLKETRDTLGSRLWDEYQITYEDAVALNYPPVTAENRGEVAAQFTTLKARLKGIGNVNVNAIEEFQEVNAKYEAMQTQHNDLVKSYDELQNIIAKLEEEMQTTFLSAFQKINENFGTVFRELFGGGSAELSLTEPDSVLTSGIEIKAAPPGKIIKSLSLLSGGEQSFVAIALFFSILKVNPTPFCILDEIEAALDEVNVYRLGEYIKKFCSDTQFVLITHRRGTMEIADRLYGITMPERGISRVIPLDVNEIESKKKELFDGVL